MTKIYTQAELDAGYHIKDALNAGFNWAMDGGRAASVEVEAGWRHPCSQPQQDAFVRGARAFWHTLTK